MLTFLGSFIFEKPIFLNQSLRVLGYLNGIDPARWEAVAVTTNNLVSQFISGKWVVFGNVYFEKGASGNDMLNGTNITELSNTLAKEHLGMNDILAENSVWKPFSMNLRGINDLEICINAHAFFLGKSG